jgi:hypothetical protein
VRPATRHLALLAASCCLGLFAPPRAALAAGTLEPAQLPTPAQGQIDFARDIKPILDTSCLRCHGPEKPKSDFRLDNRAAALKGGDRGADILPGDSAYSPLIHYVAGVVEDMEMPPPEKGEPLTTNQVALLRAWIDQGAAWDTNAPAASQAVSISPAFGGTAVGGNLQKFRELAGQAGGLNGGLSQFDLSGRSGPDTKYSFTGHLLQDDYKLALSLDRPDLGYIHSGWEQWRKWYSDTGGFSPELHPSAADFGHDLHLDIGHAWVDFGLTLPHLPQMKLGYEYDYKRGGEATTDWGTFAFGNLRAIAPAAKYLDEGTHVIKFGLDHELGGMAIEERFRGEYYDLKTRYTNNDVRGAGGLTTENARESDSYFQGANTLRVEKKFNDWSSVSAGWLYSRLNSDASFTDSVNNNPLFLDLLPDSSLQKDSQVFNLNALLGPFEGLTFIAGLQPEWTRQQGLGGANAFLNPVYTNGASFAPATLPVVPSLLSSDYNQNSITESAALRYNKIPHTALFAEARFQQQGISQYDLDLQPSTEFLQNTSFASQESDLRFGFNTSPWRAVSLDAHYRRYENDSQYENNPGEIVLQGYPGFIKERDLKTDEIEAKLTLHPCAWMRAALSYQYLTTSSWTDTTRSGHGVSDGGGIYSGESYSQIYSLNTTFTPWRRLFLSATFSYQPSSTTTADHSVPTVAAYRGDMATVLATANYVISPKADCFATYSFSEADYAQNNFAAGLPVGIEYRMHILQAGVDRRFGKNVTAQLKYNYYCYNEPTSAGINNFAANAIFATLTCRWP